MSEIEMIISMEEVLMHLDYLADNGVLKREDEKYIIRKDFFDVVRNKFYYFIENNIFNNGADKLGGAIVLTIMEKLKIKQEESEIEEIKKKIITYTEILYTFPEIKELATDIKALDLMFGSQSQQIAG